MPARIIKVSSVLRRESLNLTNNEENTKLIQYLCSMGESKRQLKVGRQLQKDLSEIFRLKLSDSLKNALLTITRVDVSPDLSVAKIYISVFSTGAKQDAVEQINQEKGELRRALGMRIGKQVRKVPELIFVEDHGSEHASNIESILSRLDIPPQSD